MNASQSGSGTQSESVYATISPVAAAAPTLRAIESPLFSWLMISRRAPSGSAS